MSATTGFILPAPLLSGHALRTLFEELTRAISGSQAALLSGGFRDLGDCF
jgi:hypothetical protein